jgi:hypothetical protein
MDSPELSIIAGALAGTLRPKCSQVRDELAKRWRSENPGDKPSEMRDVIPLLDGWIRRLARQAGVEPEVDAR